MSSDKEPVGLAEIVTIYKQLKKSRAQHSSVKPDIFKISPDSFKSEAEGLTDSFMPTFHKPSQISNLKMLSIFIYLIIQNLKSISIIRNWPVSFKGISYPNYVLL